MGIELLGPVEYIDEDEDNVEGSEPAAEPARWFLGKHKLTAAAGQDFLKLLRTLGHSVPRTREMLFENDSVFTMQDLKRVPIKAQYNPKNDPEKDGQYLHIGLYQIAKTAFENFSLLKLKGQLFSDGAGLTNSSTKNLWVILFKDSDDRFYPILIGCYSGYRKFDNFDTFFEDTVMDFEVNDKTGE